MFQSLEYKHPKFYQVFRLFIVFFASLFVCVESALFCQNGRPVSGRIFSGLSLLLQQIGLDFIHVSIPFSVFNIGLNLVPTYIAYKFIGKKFTLYSIIVIVLTSIFYRYASGVCVYKGCAADQCVWWTDQWICHQSKRMSAPPRVAPTLSASFITAEGH